MADGSPAHEWRTARLVLASAIGFVALAGAQLAAARLAGPLRPVLLAALAVAQGLWMYRLYVVAHEGVHRKLFPRWPWLNDLVAALLLAPIGAPLAIYRKVHHFHHGSNRKDAHHAALDHFRVGDVSSIGRVYYRAVWFFYVFCGGFFLHSLITILIFLLVPTAIAVRIDPAFARWTPAARARAWGELGLALGLHLGVAATLGGHAWLLVFGAPLAVFAWVWSLFLYIYHYGTSVGPETRYNVRSLPRHWFFSWLLLNFNEHVTHHADPSIPWYQLPERRRALPAAFAANQNVGSVWAAVWQQTRGPVLAAKRARPEARS